MSELNRLYHTRFYTRQYNPHGMDVISEDWDNLVILDACRYDMFESKSDLEGNLQRRTSRGSTTVEFLNGNFGRQELNDTVYVTANPQLYYNNKSVDTNFHAEVNVWAENGWDKDYGTVRPETVTEYALEAEQKYPRKRLIVHYVQPHYPFIAGDIETGTGDFDGESLNIWEKLTKNGNKIDEERVIDSYHSNLSAVLPDVKKLCSDLNGKTVVTSDHGNLLGERSSPIPVTEWGHPRGTYVESLTTVPWLVMNATERKEVISETSGPRKTIERSVVNKRLEDLGYK
ncbi:hypothetical protein [Halobacterium sp. KA-6]|uniref:hypothetical protein n=1 Tax=Halobacterium sp. KA-6 TaxID=2896368 RepID=UPI001E4471A7|nr:hypothetical protein [Halobacterium sp. KA-6]MCD2204875.1 hypothetical protein [Halobacterium sp. KA-6]